MRACFYWLSLSVASLQMAIAAPSAASQFSLDPSRQISACFLQCHEQILTLIHDIDDPLAIPQAIEGNCRLDSYLNTMSDCLAQTCESAPAAAYAIEYGHSFCQRAGVDVNEKLVLPELYISGPAKAYFQSEAYLTSSAVRSASPLFLSFAPIASVLYWIFETSGARDDGERERIRMVRT